MLRLRPFVATTALAALVTMLACVGSDPDPLAGSPGSDSGASSSGNASPDAGNTAETGADESCNPDAPFGAPTPIAGLRAGDHHVALARDETIAAFHANRLVKSKIYYAKRANRSAAFDSADFVPIESTADASIIEGDGESFYPTLSEDGLRLGYLRDGTFTVALRVNADAPFSQVISGWRVPPASGYYFQGFFFTPNAAAVYVTVAHESGDGPVGNASIARVPRTEGGATYELVGMTPLDLLGAGSNDQNAAVNPDETRIFFASDRPINGTRPPGKRLWTSRRATADEPWEPPTLVSEVTDVVDGASYLSADGCRLVVDLGAQPSQPTLLRRGH